MRTKVWSRKQRDQSHVVRSAEPTSSSPWCYESSQTTRAAGFGPDLGRV